MLYTKLPNFYFTKILKQSFSPIVWFTSTAQIICFNICFKGLRKNIDCKNRKWLAHYQREATFGNLIKTKEITMAKKFKWKAFVKVNIEG